MGLPKQHLPGQTFHSIRRTVEGTFFLAPYDDCRRALAYTYGLGVEASGVIPHAEVTMSNHRQGALTCLTGRRSKFHEKHHGIFARKYNGRLRRCGYMWDHRGPTEPVVLPDCGEDEDDENDKPRPFNFLHEESEEDQERWRSRWDALGLDDVDRTILYDLMNPVSANLVQHFRTFPGFKVGPEDWGKWIVCDKPGWINESYPPFSAFMALPPPRWWDQVELIDTDYGLVLVAPQVLAAFEDRRKWAKEQRPTGSQRLDPVAFELFISAENLERARVHYLDHMDTLEEQFRVERADKGIHVLGRRALKAQDWRTKPDIDIVLGNSAYQPRFIGSPTAMARAFEAYNVFCHHYWWAGRCFRSRRDFNVVFPAGTVRMPDVANVHRRARPLPEENPMRAP